MPVWFSPNHRTEFSDVGTIFRDCFLAKFEDCFVDEIIAVNGNLEIFFKKTKTKTKSEISRPS